MMILTLFAFTYCTYVAYVAIKVVLDITYSAQQKWLQVLTCLFIPVLGVIFCHFSLNALRPPSKKIPGLCGASSTDSEILMSIADSDI